MFKQQYWKELTCNNVNIAKISSFTFFNFIVYIPCYLTIAVTQDRVVNCMYSYCDMSTFNNMDLIAIWKKVLIKLGRNPGMSTSSNRILKSERGF